MENKSSKTPARLFFPSHLIEEAPYCTRCAFFSLVAAVFLLFCVGTVFLIAFIVVHPRAPLWDIEDVQISRLAMENVTTHADKGPLLNVEMTVKMSAQNRVKKQGLWYETTVVTAFVFSELGGEVTIPPFHQGAQELSEQQAFISGRQVAITREAEAAKLQGVMANSIKSVEVHVDVYVRAKVRILEWLKHHYKLRLQCDVTVSSPLPPGQSSSLISKSCQEEKHWLSHS